MVHDNSYDSYIILEDGKYIGTSSISSARDVKMMGWGEIISIYLLPEYFGKGYGELLLKYSMDVLRKKGYKHIYLGVLKENTRARTFYEKHRFHNNDDASLIEIAGEELTEIRCIKILV